jgi:hypothetical protein
VNDPLQLTKIKFGIGMSQFEQTISGQLAIAQSGRKSANNFA